MASSRALLICIVLSFALLNLLQSHPTMAGSTSGNPNGISAASIINCEGACKYRCSKSWKPKMCNKMCLACCHKCGCVPPGPTASRDVCSCYAHLKNPKGFNKCP